MTVMTLSGTDTKWSCADGDTIMRSGLGFPYECNVGSSGNCRFRSPREIEELRPDAPGLSVHPLSLLPVRNIPVIKPAIDFIDKIDPADVAARINESLSRLDLGGGESPVAVCYDWDGSASYRRLDGFCRGVIEGLKPVLSQGHPLILVGNGDVGGLVGMHCKLEAGISSLVSIDGIKLDEFDFIDIGAMLETSGAVPVVINSLVFPDKKLGSGG